MQKYTILGLVLLVLLGGLIWFYWPEGGVTPPISTTQENPPLQTADEDQSSVQVRSRVAPSGTEGRVTFRVKDAAASMDGVKAIIVTVNKVEVHSQAKGWITVANDIFSYDLFALKRSGVAYFLADANLNAGTYDQVQVSIEKVLVIRRDGRVEEAILPAKTMAMNTKLVVAKGENSGVTIDFKADRSLSTTQRGVFVFTPVVELTAESVITTIQIRGVTVDFIEGRSDFNAEYGMDEKGSMKLNFELDAKAKLDIIGNTLKLIP